MKKTTKVICLTLAAIMFLVPLSACKSSSSITTESSYSIFDGDDVTTTAGTTGNTGSTGSTGKTGNTGSNGNGGGSGSNTKLEKKYENLDLKGATISMAAPWKIEPGKSGTSTVATLQRKRIAELEKKYNCKFKWVVYGNEFSERLRTSVAANKPVYDFVILYTSAIPGYAYNGYLQNLDKIDAIDVTNNKWNLGAVSNGAFNGGHYTFNIGSAVPRYVLTFNKTLFDKNKWGDPYQLYYNGKWTWDELIKIAQKATDKNAGRYGIGGIELATSSIIASYGGSVISMDSKGKPTFTGDSAECSQAISLICDLKNKYKDYVWSPESYTWTTAINGLAEGKVAMAVTQMYMIRENILDMEDDYGIVPMPKGSNSKGRYASVQNDIPTWTMLANNPLAQEKAYVLNLYTEPYKGYEDIISKAELETYCRDNDSVKILLDVEKNYGLFDYSTWFSNAGSVYSSAIDSVISGTATFSEAMGKNKSKIVQSMNDTYKAWQE